MDVREHIAQRKKQDKRRPLPVIINLCLYSGKKTPYPHSVDIYDCFEDPVLARAELFKPLSLIDLGQMSEAELKKHGTADLMGLLLKQSRERTFLKWIHEHAEEIRKLLDRYYGISGMHYILANERNHIPNQIIDAIIAIAPQKEQVIMTAAQQLRQEGRQEGMHTKSLEIAKNMLQSHEPKEKIHQFTGLSWVEIEALIREQETAKQ